jgi:hypothetical protein
MTAIFGQTISLYKVLGVPTMSIHEKNGRGYHDFSLNIIKQFRTALIDWCKKENIEINCDLENYGESVVERQSTTNDEKKEDKYDNLIKLKSLLDSGIITQEEFDSEKKKILEQ